MPSGRVRTFDADEALDKALEVFWRRGYEGTTLDELTSAMGINRPSLYATFGNKQQLFQKALDRYRAGPIAFVELALAEPTARKVAETLLFGVVRMLSNSDHPAGCLIVNGALACGVDADPIREELAASREQAVVAMRKRFQQAVREHDLPRGTDCGALARYLATLIHGFSVQAVSGATEAELRKVAELALKVWPG